MTRLDWDEYAVRLARTASLRSEDPYHKVGAAILRADNTVAALGYNGAPPGVNIDWTDRDERRKFVVHAEANALRYVHPGEGELIATTMMSCANCVLLIASYGIKRIVYADLLDPAIYDIAFTKQLADDCGIPMIRRTD